MTELRHSRLLRTRRVPGKLHRPYPAKAGTIKLTSASFEILRNHLQPPHTQELPKPISHNSHSTQTTSNLIASLFILQFYLRSRNDHLFQG